MLTSQIKRLHIVRLHLYEISRKVKFIETEIRSMTARVGDGSRNILKGYRGSQLVEHQSFSS